MHPLDSTEAHLREEIAPRLAKKQALLEEIAEIDQELAPREEMLADILKRKAKPNAKKSDILPVCKQLVKDNPGIEEAALLGLAKERLTDTLGFSHNGLGSNLKRSLKDKAFRIDSEGRVSLAAESTASGKRSG